MKTPCYVKTGRCCLFKRNNLLGINFSDLITVVFYSECPFTFIFPSANSS